MLWSFPVAWGIHHLTMCYALSCARTLRAARAIRFFEAANSHVEVLSARRYSLTRHHTINRQHGEWFQISALSSFEQMLHEPWHVQFVSWASRRRGDCRAPRNEEINTARWRWILNNLNMKHQLPTRQSIAAYDCVGEYSNKTPSSGLELRGTIRAKRDIYESRNRNSKKFAAYNLLFLPR